MKWIVVLASSLFAVNAFAVNTKSCPNRLTVSYQNVKLNVSLEDLQSEMGIVGENEEQMKAVENAYNIVDLETPKTVKFDLESAKDGRCTYRRLGDDSIEKIELYTFRKKDGKQDMLMLQTLTGDDTRGILARVYAKLDSVMKSQITVKDAKVGLALAIPRYPYTDYSAGGDLKFIGKVKDLEVTVE